MPNRLLVPTVRSLLAGGALLATTVAVVPPAPSAVAESPFVSANYHPLTPARLLDTRPGYDTVDGQAAGEGAVGPDSAIALTVAGRGGVPATGVGAVAVNVAVTQPTRNSFLTAYPAGSPRPTAANLNFSPDQSVSNMAIVGVGAGGAISLYNFAGSSHLVVDVLGWFPSGSITYAPLTPSRLLDTRPGFETVDGIAQGTGALSPDSARVVQITGRGGVPPTGVGAVAVNLAAIEPTHGTYLTAYPSDAARPTAASLNVISGRIVSNMAIVPVDPAGRISVYNFDGFVHLTVDVLGWFPVGSTFRGLVPARVLDSRPGSPTLDDAYSGVGRLGPGESFDVQVIGRGEVPGGGVGAVAVNIAVTDPTAASYITAHPSDTSRPLAANLNFVAGQTVSNTAIVPVGAGGTITLFNYGGSTHVVVDLLGWFPPGAVAPSTIRASVSRTGAEADGESLNPRMSADGRYTVFDSAASNLVPGDTNGFVDVFRRDLITGEITRVNVAGDGQQTIAIPGHGSPTFPNRSIMPSISGDGRYVAYQTDSASTIVGDTNDLEDVYVRDVVAGVTTRVSVATGGGQADGPSGEASISRDGRFVAFSSSATNLVASDTNGRADVFVHDRTAGSTTRVSVATGGGQAGGASVRPAISADGRFVAFESDAADLVGGDTNGETDVFVHDRTTGSTTRVSVATGGGQGTGGGSIAAALSGDGRFVAFHSAAADLVAGESSATLNVYLHDRDDGSTVRISRAGGGGLPDGESAFPAVTDDGRFVAFVSRATDIAGSDAAPDVFVIDRTSGTTTRVSVSPSGDAANGAGTTGGPSFSADGRFLAYRSVASNLVTGDLNGQIDVFARDAGAS